MLFPAMESKCLITHLSCFCKIFIHAKGMLDRKFLDFIGSRQHSFAVSLGMLN